MRVSQVHCRVRDSQAAARWFAQVWQVVPVVHNDRAALRRGHDRRTHDKAKEVRNAIQP